ncbi:beta/gamma crystallin-related protein [Rhodoferax sp.]|uniref:beta/gamma crystallin-related protein n=1 Tax=Rhodoferax sp. TaxID=50421 RepID=UPI0025E89D4F|nr:beta/gamma crystallin-related protein [Rhodoferax sp.]
MHTPFKTTLAIAALAIAGHAAAQATFYENEGFQGRSFTSQNRVENFQRFGFNDRASSVVVLGQRQEVCEDAQFSGRCVVLRPGRYPSLAAMGLNDRVSSVRVVGGNARVDDGRYAPPPEPVYDNRRRNNERLYEADVTSVRAVVGPPQQRCWMEKEEVQQQGGANIGGAVVGALLGGILGHQVGGGRGQDIATAGGAVAGAAVGSQVGRNGGRPAQNVQRCANEPAARPAYWDVTYNFRGQEHRIQMTSQPGRTVTVNRQGEPRV